jgi:hypothetical protein
VIGEDCVTLQSNPWERSEAKDRLEPGLYQPPTGGGSVPYRAEPGEGPEIGGCAEDGRT